MIHCSITKTIENESNTFESPYRDQIMNTLTFKENSMSKILCYNDNFYTTNQITSLAEHICRFNNLHEHSFSKKEIDIMPTFTLNALDYLRASEFLCLEG